jgi:hypothetical protein
VPTTPITDWGTAIVSSLTAAFALLLGAITRIIGFLLILIIGWMIASAIAGIVRAVLRGIRFNEMASRAGIEGFLQRAGVQQDSSSIVAEVVKWFVRLITLVVAFDALGVPTVSAILTNLVLWLPALFVALIVLVVTGLVANAVYRLVQGSASGAGLPNAEMLGTIARVAVWAFGIIVAVNQIGVASSLINILFASVVTAMTLAFGLAFGLGGRETAGLIVRNWYESSQKVAARKPASEKGERAEREAEERRRAA